jgi:hypothetical protein
MKSPDLRLLWLVISALTLGQSLATVSVADETSKPNPTV